MASTAAQQYWSSIGVDPSEFLPEGYGQTEPNTWTFTGSLYLDTHDGWMGQFESGSSHQFFLTLHVPQEGHASLQMYLCGGNIEPTKYFDALHNMTREEIAAWDRYMIQLTTSVYSFSRTTIVSDSANVRASTTAGFSIVDIRDEDLPQGLVDDLHRIDNPQGETLTLVRLKLDVTSNRSNNRLRYKIALNDTIDPESRRAHLNLATRMVRGPVRPTISELVIAVADPNSELAHAMEVFHRRLATELGHEQLVAAMKQKLGFDCLDEMENFEQLTNLYGASIPFVLADPEASPRKTYRRFDEFVWIDRKSVIDEIAEALDDGTYDWDSYEEPDMQVGQL